MEGAFDFGAGGAGVVVFLCGINGCVDLAISMWFVNLKDVWMEIDARFWLGFGNLQIDVHFLCYTDTGITNL